MIYFIKYSFLVWNTCFKSVKFYKYLLQAPLHLWHFLGSERLTGKTFLLRRKLTTTTKETIKYKICFDKGISSYEKLKNEKWNLEWQNDQQNPNVKRKKSSYNLLPLETFHIIFTNKTEIFATSTQFKSINETLAVFLKLNIGTCMKQTARFTANLLRMLEQKERFLS